MSQIGFIGLGNMGGPMVSNLIQDGHKVKAYDIIPEAIDRAVNKGATKANSAEETIIDAEFVITMLPAGEHVRSVYLEDNKILYSVSPKTVLSTGTSLQQINFCPSFMIVFSINLISCSLLCLLFGRKIIPTP